MAKPQLAGLLVFGVDVGSSEDWASGPTKLLKLAELLSRQLQSHQIAATWTVPHRATHQSSTRELFQTLRQATVAHELGLKWEGDAIRCPSEMFAFNAALRDQVQRLGQMGVRPKALAADPRTTIPYAAVAKAGFRAVRPTRVRSLGQVRCVQTQTMRYGLWGLPVSCFWPNSVRFMQRYMARQLTHQSRLAVKNDQLLHVVLDLPMLAEADSSLSGMSMFLDCLAEIRKSTTLRTARLADIDQLVLRKTSALKPARSILRSVA